MTTVSPEQALADVTACVFDAYGTLFDVATPAGKCSAELGDKAPQLAAIWRTKQLEYTWLRSLMGEYVDFWQVTGQGLDFAMAALEIDDLALRARLMEMYLELDCYPEVPEMLRRVRDGGKTTGILTNGSPTMITAALKSAALYDVIDHRMTVDPLRIYRPDPRVYQIAVDTIGAEPAQICFMSSNAWDVAGAAHFGFQVVWINRFGQPRERLPGTPVAELTSLEDLPTLLGL